MQEECENNNPSFLTVFIFGIYNCDRQYSAFHYKQIYMGHSVYRNRIDTDFTVNKFETAHEVNVLLKPHINLQESTMLQPP